jgi:hypothetical protein
MLIMLGPVVRQAGAHSPPLAKGRGGVRPKLMAERYFLEMQTEDRRLKEMRVRKPSASQPSAFSLLW